MNLVGGGSDDSPFFVFLKVFFCISVFACCMTLVGGGSGDSPRSPPYHTQAASVGGTREAKLLTHKIVVFPFLYFGSIFFIFSHNFSLTSGSYFIVRSLSIVCKVLQLGT